MKRIASVTSAPPKLPIPMRTLSLDETIGSRIRARRSELGLMRDDLAKLAKIASDRLKLIESGEVRARGDELIAMSLPLEIKISSFFDAWPPQIVTKLGTSFLVIATMTSELAQLYLS